MSDEQSRLEPSLEREGAGGRSKPSLGKEGWVVVKKRSKMYDVRRMMMV